MGRQIQWQVFFSQAKANSCGVLIGHYRNKRLEIIDKNCDNSGRILLLENNIADSLFVLINIDSLVSNKRGVGRLLIFL